MCDIFIFKLFLVPQKDETFLKHQKEKWKQKAYVIFISINLGFGQEGLIKFFLSGFS